MEAHGGNLEATARRLGCRPDQILDASASLAPFALPREARRALRQVDLRAYPDRSHWRLRHQIARLHDLDPELVLPGNGAAELFTWAARDAAAVVCRCCPSRASLITRALFSVGAASSGPWPFPWSGTPHSRNRFQPPPLRRCSGSPTPITPPDSSGAVRP